MAKLGCWKQSVEKRYGKKYRMKICEISIPKGHGAWYTVLKATKKDPYALKSKKIIIMLYKKARYLLK